VNSPEEIGRLRGELDKLTEKFIELLSVRDKLVMRIGEEKKKSEVQVQDPDREKDIIERAEKTALEKGVDPAYAKELVELMVRHGRRLQR